VTQLFDIMIMATPEIEIYTSRTLPNWERYASRHGYSLHVYDSKPLPEMHVNWSKIEHARRHLDASIADWVVVADADTWVNTPDRSLDEFIGAAARNGQDMVFSSDVSNWFGMLFPLNSLGVRECRRWICPNAGFFAVRNNAAGNRFLDDWMKLALRHLCRYCGYASARSVGVVARIVRSPAMRCSGWTRRVSCG
jgi:hypothetical protein